MAGQGSDRSAWFRGIASGCALVLLVLGVPVVLMLEGESPFKANVVQGIRQLFADRHGLDAQVVSHWIFHVVIGLAWMTWIWVAACVFMELRAWRTGRSPAPVPGSRTMQAAIACLIGATLSLVVATEKTSLSPSRPAAAVRPTPPMSIHVVGVSDVHLVPIAFTGAPLAIPAVLDVGGQAGPDSARSVMPRGSGPSRSPSGPPPSAPSTELAIHVVRSRETLWSISERRLGSALRWREIAELNYGIRQPDGRSLTPDNWIMPGWTLRIPESSQAGESMTAVPADLATFTGETDAGEGPSIGSATGRPDAGRAGPSGGIPVAPIASGLIGGGVVILLERLRRMQHRHRDEGRHIRMPNDAQRRFEQCLRAGESRWAPTAIRSALRMLLGAAVRETGSAPDVRGACISRDGLELILGDVGDAPWIPPPFRARGTESGTTVAVDRREFADLGDVGGIGLGQVAGSPCPALLTLGSDGNSLLLVNLEALGTISLLGDDVPCQAMLRAMTLELATSGWADQVELVLVGFGEELRGLGRVDMATDMTALTRRLRERRQRIGTLLCASGSRTLAEARLTDESDVWDVVVVLCSRGIDLSEVTAFCAEASLVDSGIVVVLDGVRTEAAHVIDLARPPKSWAMDLLQTSRGKPGVTVREVTGIGELLAVAADMRSVTAETSPYGTMSIPLPRPPASIGSSPTSVTTRSEQRDDEPEVEVAVIGPVEVRGASRPFTRAWAKELVVFLALHPEGASNDAWATALWPDRLMAPSSLHSTASVARRSLGQARDGSDHLPRSHGRLALARSVGTDWDRFVALADSDDPHHWRAAIELVRGRPFDGLRAADWPILEGIAPAMEASIVDLAGRLSGHYLRTKLPAGAEWAARKGLVVSPYDERLYRMLLRAADLAGNPAGVEAVMSELVRLVADDVEPFDSVHPETVELYRSLTRHRKLTPLPL